MSPELHTVIRLARQAGDILMRYFKQELEVAYKKNKFDPVTQADKEADHFLRTELAKEFPGDEILSEEHEARPRSYNGRVWMVDPLDGTKAFIAGNPGFSVIIGLYENHQPALGVVYAPVTNQLFYAQRGKGSFTVINGQTRQNQATDVQRIKDARLYTRYKLEGDVRPLDATVDGLPFKERISASSIGIKLGLIAGGQGDVFAHTDINANKWDTLAGEIILSEAGGVVSDIEGVPLDYEKLTVEWDKYVLAASNRELLDDMVGELKK